VLEGFGGTQTAGAGGGRGGSSSQISSGGGGPWRTCLSP